MSMDINKIFGMFGADDNKTPIYSKEDLETMKKLEEYKETPMFKIGMFKKLIFNHISYKDKVISLFKNVKPELEIWELEEAGEHITFERGWEFIGQCKLQDDRWKSSLIIAHDIELETAIKLTMNYFQGIEEYEKCAYLKKIIDFLEKNLETKP